MDRRWKPRMNMHLGIRLIPVFNKRVVAATLRNISLRGAFIEMQALLPSNAHMLIELKFPGNLLKNSFHLYARIVRRTPAGAGVAFVGVPAGVISVLEQVLYQYEQQPDLFPI
jgi:hypothetical protein